MAGTIYSKFFWQDWHGDDLLQRCSMSAQGFWMRLLCLVARSDTRGHVLLDGRKPTTAELLEATRCRRDVTEAEVEGWISELVDCGVCDLTREGVMVSRRMTRDALKLTHPAIAGGKARAKTAARVGGRFAPAGATSGPPATTKSAGPADDSENPANPNGSHQRTSGAHQPPSTRVQSPSAISQPPEAASADQKATDAGRLATLSKLLDLDYNRSPTGTIAYIQQLIDLGRAGIDIERDLIPCVEQMLASGRDVRGKPFTYFRQPALDFQKARTIAADVEVEFVKRAEAKIAAMTTADWTRHVLWWLFLGEWPEEFGAPPLQVGCRAPIEAHVIRNLFKKLDGKPYAKRKGSGFEPFAWPAGASPKLLCSDLEVADMERFFGGGYDARSDWWAKPATAAEIGAILDQYDPKRPKLGAM